MAAKFEISQDKSGNFRFQLKAANGEIIAISQWYKTRAGAEKGIESVKTNAPGARINDIAMALTGVVTAQAEAEQGIEDWLDSVEPDPADARDASHIRRIIAAAESVAAAQSELQAAVDAARAAGDTWDAIGAALGTSRQNAYQRFGERHDLARPKSRPVPAAHRL